MNELKRELSKLSGIDFFNPKYRDVFKKYFPDDEDMEEKKLNEMFDDEPELLETKGIEENPQVDEEKVVEPEYDVEDKEDKVEDIKEDIDKAEDEREIDKIEEDKAENDDVRDEKKEEVNEESEEIGKKVDDLKDSYEDELFDAKLELALIRNKVREDKLEPAKDFLKYKLDGLKDLEQVDAILKDYPEWIKRDRNEVKGFGMPVDEIEDNLTEEEKRLKAMGIDPR